MKKSAVHRLAIAQWKRECLRPQRVRSYEEEYWAAVEFVVTVGAFGGLALLMWRGVK